MFEGTGSIGGGRRKAGSLREEMVCGYCGKSVFKRKIARHRTTAVCVKAQVALELEGKGEGEEKVGQGETYNNIRKCEEIYRCW